MNDTTRKTTTESPFFRDAHFNYTLSMKFIDLTGKKFSRLLVLKYTGGRLWDCLCDCGTSKSIRGDHLKSGIVVSCGCYNAEKAKRKNRITLTPGYATWNGMKARCYNVNDDYFHRYGGRGITVCDRWLKFENFLADMGEKPKGMSLDRIDNNGNYCPENCRWATSKEQANNRVSNYIIKIGDEEKTASQWAEKMNVNPISLIKRIKVYGWSPEMAIMTPGLKKNKAGWAILEETTNQPTGANNQ